MDVVVPWCDLEALIEPYYPKAGNGRQPVGLSIMLRAFFLQQWFNLSDPGAEDALYELPVLRRFVGVDSGPCLRTRRDHDSSLPPPAGAARTLRPDTGHGEPLPGEQRPEHIYRYHRRCHDHRSSVLDQEQQERAGSGDASDAQGEPVVCVTNTSASPWNCTEDGSRSPGAGLQEQASNRLMLLRRKGVVVNDEEKSPQGGRCGWRR
jgi:hypothetical protein